MNTENARIGIIGLGSMSSAIVKGFITYGGIDPTRITASARNRARLESNCKALGIHPGTTAEVAENSDIVIVGVIPTQVENVLREVRDLLPGKIIVSIAYGISHQRYMELLPEGCHVICVVRPGMFQRSFSDGKAAGDFQRTVRQYCPD